MDFPNTPYSLLANTAMRSEALEYFCRNYRAPVISFLRARGVFMDRIEDMAHDFLLQFISGNSLRRMDRKRGRFRTYLLTALRRFMASDILKNRTQIRGGDLDQICFDDEEIGNVPCGVADAESLAHDREWAIALYLAAYDRLEAELKTLGKERRFKAYQPFLKPNGEAPSMDLVGRELGISEVAVRKDLGRIRRRFAELFRIEVAQTVASAEEIEEEVQYVLRAISSPGANLGA